MRNVCARAFGIRPNGHRCVLYYVIMFNAYTHWLQPYAGTHKYLIKNKLPRRKIVSTETKTRGEKTSHTITAVPACV